MAPDSYNYRIHKPLQSEHDFDQSNMISNHKVFHLSMFYNMENKKGIFGHQDPDNDGLGIYNNYIIKQRYLCTSCILENSYILNKKVLYSSHIASFES